LAITKNKNILVILGNIPPGSPGGGAPPTAGGGASLQTLKVAIDLVPAGLPPIAVFPPYIKPRTVPGVSVIFAENPNVR
jgi:hypothetical protein